jgi:hypothetical protein
VLGGQALGDPVAEFEPTASCSRSRRATKPRHSALRVVLIDAARAGDVNDQDYPEGEMSPGEVYDHRPSALYGGRVGVEDTAERYVLEQRSSGWVFVHTGTVEQPVEDRAFLALIVGGPDDGQTKYLLGSARRLEGRPVGWLAQGCVLHHVGDDPASGWELRYQG